MHTVNHRLDHFGESLGQMLRRLLPMALSWLAAVVERSANRHAVRQVVEPDDILWDDGEPEEKR